MYDRTGALTNDDDYSRRINVLPGNSIWCLYKCPYILKYSYLYVIPVSLIDNHLALHLGTEQLIIQIE